MAHCAGDVELATHVATVRAPTDDGGDNLGRARHTRASSAGSLDLGREFSNVGSMRVARRWKRRNSAGQHTGSPGSLLSANLCRTDFSQVSVFQVTAAHRLPFCIGGGTAELPQSRLQQVE